MQYDKIFIAKTKFLKICVSSRSVLANSYENDNTIEYTGMNLMQYYCLSL